MILGLDDDHCLPLHLLLKRLCRHVVEDHVLDDPPLVADLSHSGTVAGPYQLLQQLSYWFHRLGELRDSVVDHWVSPFAGYQG